MPAFWLRVVRALSVLDGLSYVYLLFHAIYSKRIMGDEEAIQTPGMIHGFIFTALVIALLVALPILAWSLRRAALVVVCAFVPFAPFFLEGSLRREQIALQEQKSK
ncbi:MAG TPA: hypothetical protein DDW52_05840 [Planctomycetaceae bacterium]|nr:hypothetical protein [Planctomycetaceae bacterium]